MKSHLAVSWPFPPFNILDPLRASSSVVHFQSLLPKEQKQASVSFSFLPFRQVVSVMFRTQSPFLVPPSVFLPVRKRSPTSSKALAVLFRSFDDNLLRRLKTLDPPAVSFAWLARALDVLVSTVADAEALISDLKLVGSEKSLAAYLDDSVKVLDVCNSVTAEMERLRQGRLLVTFVVHLVRRSGEADAVLTRARDSLAEYWTSRAVNGNRGRFVKSEVVVRDLALGLGSPPKGKISTEEKLLRRTLYAVGTVTIFVIGATLAILDASPGPISTAEVHGDYPWADTLNRLSTALGDEIRERFAGQSRRSASEAEAMEKGLRSVSDVIDAASEEFTVNSRKFVNAVNTLETVTEDFSDKSDELLNSVNGFFHTVLSTRNAFLQSFRQ